MSRSLTKEPQKSTGPTPAESMYERDFYGWINQQVELLRSGRLDQLDAEKIAEELEDVAGREYDKLESNMRVLLMHMLKWDQQPERRSRSWEHTIREHRRRIKRILDKNPGLKARLGEATAEGFQGARGWAVLETSLPDSEFPDDCPYDPGDIFERPFEMDSERP